MIRFESEQTIARPAEEIWAYAADLRRHAEWMDIIDARLVSGEPTAVGARAIERVKLGPGTADQEIVVSASEPGRRIAWRMADGGPLAGEMFLDLESLGPTETRVRWSGGLQLTGWRRLLEPFMAAEAKAGEAAELRRLKEIVERAPAEALTSTGFAS